MARTILTDKEWEKIKPLLPDNTKHNQSRHEFRQSNGPLLKDLFSLLFKEISLEKIFQIWLILSSDFMT